MYDEPTKNKQAMQTWKLLYFASRNPCFLVVAKLLCIIESGLVASEFISHHYSSSICKMDMVSNLQYYSMCQLTFWVGKTLLW